MIASEPAVYDRIFLYGGTTAEPEAGMERSFIQKELVYRGCPLHYWAAAGKGGKWTVFLHGAGADHRMFEAQVPAVPEEYGVLLLDIRGHGESRPMGESFSVRFAVDDILRVMDAEGMQKAVLVGQSMGGNIAQEIAFLHKERVERLVLIDCTRNVNRLTRAELLAVKSAPGMMALYPFRTLAQQSANLCSDNEAVRAYILECFEKIGKADFVKVFSELALCLHEEPGYAYSLPMLVLCGEHDKTGNIRKILGTWATNEPDCSVHLIKNAGHLSNMDCPEEVNALLAAFLNR